MIDVRIEGDLRRLSSDTELPARAGAYESIGVVGDPTARGRAYFESITVRCGRRGSIGAGQCLRCESFVGIERASAVDIVVYCKPRSARIGSLMTPVSEYAIVSPYTRVSDAAGYAEHIGIDQLVVATDDAVVGLVCRCQLLDRSDIELVAERMRTELGRVEVDATPEETAAAIEDGGETLCVVAGDVLVGLIDRRALRGAPARPRCDTCGSCPVDLQ